MTGGAPVAGGRRKISLDAIFALAAKRHKSGKPAEAARLYRMLLAFSPESAALWSNLCDASLACGTHSTAVAAGLRGLHAKPNSVKAGLFLAQALSRQGEFKRAATVLEWAVALDPSVSVFYALGVARHSLGRYGDAVSAYRRALALAPGTPDVEHSLAHSLLTMGAFDEGWRHYLNRPSIRDAASVYDRRPLPPTLAGARLVVVGDQGLGDEIFFLRFLPALVARGARVIYCAHPKIAGPVSRLPFQERTVVNLGAVSGRIDRVLSVGDLPHLLGRQASAEIPPSIALSPLPERVEALRQRLAALGPPPYVGVIWRAGVADLLFKQAPMADLARALTGTPMTVLSLQRQPEPGEVDAFAAALGAPVADLGACNEDLEEMLALLSLLDDLVGVSNTNVHLRVALGRTARILVPFPPEFRWMAARAGSPWFPGCGVYRQTPDLRWAEAFDRLRHDVQGMVAGV